MELKINQKQTLLSALSSLVSVRILAKQLFGKRPM